MDRSSPQLPRRPRRSRSLAATLALACAGLLAAAPASALAECPNAELEAAEQSMDAIEQSVFCLINERRANAGLPAVRPSAQLAQAAASHSSDMVNRGYFAHSTPDGGSFIDRISRTGYMRGARNWLVGENLVWGSGSYSTPASMVKAWMESPGHRANLLRERFRELGVAAVRGTPYDRGEDDGVTVSSEYGQRALGKRGSRKARKARKARRARRAGRR